MQTAQLSGTQSSAFAFKRRRTIIACSYCRKRKIRCITTEQPPKNSCARCTRKNVPCEYVAISDPERDSIPHTPMLRVPAADSPAPPSEPDSAFSKPECAWALPFTAYHCSGVLARQPLVLPDSPQPFEIRPGYSVPSSYALHHHVHDLYLQQSTRSSSPTLQIPIISGDCATQNEYDDLQTVHARRYLTGLPRPSSTESVMAAYQAAAVEYPAEFEMSLVGNELPKYEWPSDSSGSRG
ncbi:hypothetical protein B0H17DRAFT_1181368 [Mycena rosella]|uniref:Zn(2)-C6 fungal-type domain-containing protein n=1 Tax=Mycena rosella TaxID=1033263 RepID=A0AAD7D959_MYCRO|nr:hypothetical protein B0H17DRAFT_1181368 [Mycena rosella]